MLNTATRTELIGVITLIAMVFIATTIAVVYAVI
jgi:hypothetical protein